MKAQTIRDVAATVQLIASKYPEVRQIGVFGSFSRGEQRPDSDVDLLVSFKGSKTYSAVFNLRSDLEAGLGRPVDLLTTVSGAAPYFKEALRKDLVRVYES